MGNLLSDLEKFISQPFRGNMDLFSVFLAVGGILVMVAVWGLILRHLE